MKGTGRQHPIASGAGLGSKGARLEGVRRHRLCEGAEGRLGFCLEGGRADYLGEGGDGCVHWLRHAEGVRWGHRVEGRRYLDGREVRLAEGEGGRLGQAEGLLEGCLGSLGLEEGSVWRLEGHWWCCYLGGYLGLEMGGEVGCHWVVAGWVCGKGRHLRRLWHLLNLMYLWHRLLP